MTHKKSEKEIFVIPAQAGIQYFLIVRILWIPVFTGMTTFYEIIKSETKAIEGASFLPSKDYREVYR